MRTKIPVILFLMLLTGNLVNAHSPQYSEKLRIGSKKIFSRVQEESRSGKVRYNRNFEPHKATIATGALDDPYGYITSYGYDGFDRISRVTDPLKNITLLGRANTGNLLSMKHLDPTGQQILLQSIRINDPAGRLTSYTVKMPNPDDDIKYTWTYEENGKRVIFKDSLERQTVVEKNDDGKVSKVTDAANNVIEYFYDDGRGNPTTIKETVKSADGDETKNETHTTEYTYNAHNQVETIKTKVFDSKTQTVVDAITTFYYDEKGNLTGTQDAEGNTITHRYDELGRRIKTEQHFKDTSLKPVETTFEYYPAMGKDPKTGEVVYSPSNRLKSITDSNGNKTIYEYDNQNRLKKVYYPDGTYPDTSSYVEYIYDINEPTGETNADGKPTYYRVVKEIQRNGTVVKHKYDQIQRLMKREIIPAEGSAGTTIEEYTYDGLSRIETAADNDTGLRFEFDRADRLDWEKQGSRQEWVMQAGKLIDYSYNKLSNLTNLTYPNTRLIERQYDQLNRMNLIKEGTFTIADMTHIGRSYRLLRKQYGNGDLITYLYDQGRRLQDLEAKNLNNNSLINHYRYGYNKINLKTYEQRLHNAGKGDVFGYDALYRLTNAKFNVPDPTIPNPTEFERERSINYNNLHSIISMVENFNGQTRSIIPEIPDGSDYWKLNQYARFDKWGLGYDKNGNTTQKGTQFFTYDYRNQLISAVDGTLSVEMKYDVMGRRVQKMVTKGSQTEVRNFYYSGYQLIEERDGNDQVTRQYIYGNGIDEIIRMDKYEGTAVTSYYFHTDSIGSVTALTDSQGNLIERVTYDTYGMPTFWDPAGSQIPESLIGNTILFQGREYDPELNLYYYRARYYDPIMGRFLQTDPIGYADSMNLYQGLNMNPINFLDPFGEETYREFLDQKIADMRAHGYTESFINQLIARGTFKIGYLTQIDLRNAFVEEMPEAKKFFIKGVKETSSETKKKIIAFLKHQTDPDTMAENLRNLPENIKNKAEEVAKDIQKNAKAGGLRAIFAIQMAFAERIYKASPVPDAKVAVDPNNPVEVRSSALSNFIIKMASYIIAAKQFSKTPQETDVVINESKMDYLFGKAKGNKNFAHNRARANQNALKMKNLGVPDNPSGFEMIYNHLKEIVKDKSNIVSTFENQYGNFEIRESLFAGPSGQFSKFVTTWQILPNGSRRFITVIPYGGI